MIKSFKNILKDNKTIGSFYFKHMWNPRKNSPEHYIRDLINRKKASKFIQIGANDGKTSDPFYRFAFTNELSGIYIEPQKYTFEKKLCKTYENKDNIILENVAIASKSESKILFKIAWSLERWATGLASFNKNSLTKQFENGEIQRIASLNGSTIPEDESKRISEEVVTCVTLDSLIKKHNYSDVDIIGIDTEGYDYEILKLIPFSMIEPKCIFFEHKHLDPISLESALRLLKNNGYSMFMDKSDFIGIRNK